MVCLSAFAKKNQSTKTKHSYCCRFRNDTINLCIYFVLADLIRRIVYDRNSQISKPVVGEHTAVDLELVGDLEDPAWVVGVLSVILVGGGIGAEERVALVIGHGGHRIAHEGRAGQGREVHREVGVEGDFDGGYE